MSREHLPIKLGSRNYLVDETKLEWQLLPVTREQIHDDGAAGEAALVQYANWKQVRQDWANGAGQSQADDPILSDSSRFHRSLGLDPSSSGELGYLSNWQRRSTSWDGDDALKDTTEEGRNRYFLEVGPSSNAGFVVDGRRKEFVVKLNQGNLFQNHRQVWGTTSTYQAQTVHTVLPWNSGIIVLPDFANDQPASNGRWIINFITKFGVIEQFDLPQATLSDHWDQLYTRFMSDGNYVFAFYETPNTRAVVQMNPQTGSNFTFNEIAIGNETNYYYGPDDMYVDKMVRGSNAIYFWNSNVDNEETLDPRIWFMDVDNQTGAFSGMKVAAELTGEVIRTVEFFNDLVGITTSKGVRLGRVNQDGTLTIGDLFESRRGCNHGIFWDNKFVFSFNHSPALEQLYEEDTWDPGLDTRLSASSIGFIDLSNQYTELGASIFETSFVVSHYKCVMDVQPPDDQYTIPGYSFNIIRINYPIRGIKAWSRRNSDAFQADHGLRRDELYVLSYLPEYSTEYDQLQVHKYDDQNVDSVPVNFAPTWARWAPEPYNRAFFDTGWVSMGTIEKKVPQVLEVGFENPEFNTLYTYYRSDLEPSWVRIDIRALSEYTFNQTTQSWDFSSKTRVARIDLDGLINMHEHVEFRFKLVPSSTVVTTKFTWWALRASPSPQTYNIVTLPVVLSSSVKWGAVRSQQKSILDEFQYLKAMADSRERITASIGNQSYSAIVDGLEIRADDVVKWGRETDFPETVCRVRLILLPTWTDVTT